MPKAQSCVEPRIGARIAEYNQDARLPSEAKKVTVEEKFMFETHLVRCAVCRSKLNLEARADFETMLILSGFFLDDPTLLEKRRKMVKKFFKNELTFKEFKGDWLEVSQTERQKLKSFLEKDC